MSNIKSMSNDKTQKFDLAERTARFSENIIEFIKEVLNNSVNQPLLNQLIRSATSIGANYMEADGAESKKDFNHKIGICKKEAKETMYWLRILAKANPSKVDASRKLWQEAHELTLIFSAIINSSKN